jgi:arsenate reductase
VTQTLSQDWKKELTDQKATYSFEEGKAEMKNILTLLGMAPRDLMRKKEAPYAAGGLGEENLSTEALIEAMRADPILIERPIVVSGTTAVLGRPPENVLKLL